MKFTVSILTLQMLHTKYDSRLAHAIVLDKMMLRHNGRPIAIAIGHQSDLVDLVRIDHILQIGEAAAVAQSVRAFDTHAKDWVFESQP